MTVTRCVAASRPAAASVAGLQLLARAHGPRCPAHRALTPFAPSLALQTGASGSGSHSSSSSTNSSSPSSPAQRLMRSAGAAFDEPADIKLGTPPEGTIGGADAVRTNLAASLGAAAGSGTTDQQSVDAAEPAAGGAATYRHAAAAEADGEGNEQKKPQAAAPTAGAVEADAGAVGDTDPGATAGHAAEDSAASGDGAAAAGAGEGEGEGEGGNRAIPRFYFPHPERSALHAPPASLRLAACQGHIDAEFEAAGPRGLRQRQFARLTKLACGLPTLFSTVLFARVRAWCRRHGVEAEGGEGKWDESKVRGLGVGKKGRLRPLRWGYLGLILACLRVDLHRWV